MTITPRIQAMEYLAYFDNALLSSVFFSRFFFRKKRA
jgi:hypothetical protein